MGFGGKGNGGGWQQPQNKFQSQGWGSNFGGKGKSKGGKNGKIHPSKTVWVGGLPSGITFGDLLNHGKQAGNAKWADVFPKKGNGTGAIGFATDEEATAAIVQLNGSIINGNMIECDSWDRPNTKGGGGKGNASGWQPRWQPQNKFQNQGVGSNFGGKGKSKGKNGKIHPSKTVWVGGLPVGISFKDLLNHGKQAGNAKWADVFPKKGNGTGALGFATEEEAIAAIAMLNGSLINGKMIECDSWEKAK